MSSDRHARIKDIFNAALALSGDERVRFLDSQCRDDAELRVEVDSLLDHDQAATFLVSDESTPEADDGVPSGSRFKAGDGFAAGRYRIVALLGRGGMGEVYRADDTTLDVTVALKLVLGESGASVSALLNEVRLARAVTHPSICRVYDVGEAEGRHFITMEYIAGENLARLLNQVGRMTPDRVRDLGAKLCEGLAAAHAEGILHRDLKPSNVMIDSDGRVVLTDFGVAATRESAGMTIVGSPAYMAPEQLSGRSEATERSDLYAVGLILYQALTGEPASTADTLEDLARVRATPPPPPSRIVPGVDADLERLILELLSPDPADRPATAAEVAAALAGTQGAAQTAPAPRSGLRHLPALLVVAVALLALAPLVTLWNRPDPAPLLPPAVVEVVRRPTALAVLPFENLGAGGPDDPLVAGIHAEILGELAKISDLRVIARSSVLRLRADPRSRQEIAADLGVGAVAEGSIRRIGDNLRVTVELVDVETEAQLLSETFDRELTSDNIFDVESEVAEKIAIALNARMTEQERARIRHDPDTSLEAYELYLLGTYNALLNSREGFEKSVAYLRAALAADPTFASAHSRLALIYVLAAVEGWLPENAAYTEARREARKALELDADLAEAYAALCRVKMQHDWAWSAAESMCARARELAPGDAQGYRTSAQLAAVRGRVDEAVELSLLALELDPVSGLSQLGAARRAWDARRYDLAANLAAEALRHDPSLGQGYRFLGLTRLFSGSVEEGLLFLEKHVQQAGRTPLSLTVLGYGYAVAGQHDRAREVLAEMDATEGIRPADRALVYLGLGRHAEALDALEQAVDERASLMIYLGVDPIFDPLRGNPRFDRLLVRVGLDA